MEITVENDEEEDKRKNLLHDGFKDMDARQNLVLPPEDLDLWTKDDKEA